MSAIPKLEYLVRYSKLDALFLFETLVKVKLFVICLILIVFLRLVVMTEVAVFLYFGEIHLTVLF